MTPQVLSPDDAYAAFKNAEGQLANAKAADGGADAQLKAANDAKTLTAGALTDANTAAKTAAEDLIAAVQAFEAGLVTA